MLDLVALAFLYPAHLLVGPLSVTNVEGERRNKSIHSQRGGQAHQPPPKPPLSVFQVRLLVGFSGQFAVCDDNILGYNSFPQYTQALGSFFVDPAGISTQFA